MQTNNSSSAITPYYQTHQTDEIDLMELFHALKKHIGLIVSITLVFACLSVVYAITATPTYQAEAVITEPTLTKVK